MVMLKNIDSDGPPKYNKLSTIIKSSEQGHAGEQYLVRWMCPVGMAAPVFSRVICLAG